LALVSDPGSAPFLRGAHAAPAQVSALLGLA